VTASLEGCFRPSLLIACRPRHPADGRATELDGRSPCPRRGHRARSGRVRGLSERPSAPLRRPRLRIVSGPLTISPVVIGLSPSHEIGARGYERDSVADGVAGGRQHWPRVRSARGGVRTSGRRKSCKGTGGEQVSDPTRLSELALVGRQMQAPSGVATTLSDSVYARSSTSGQPKLPAAASATHSIIK
jgi:hypothetical protein